MKVRVTIELDLTLDGSESVKDLCPERVAESVRSRLNYWNCGRTDLGLEVLQSLNIEAAKEAAYRALCDVLYRRYGNRMAPSGKGSKISVASLIARKRVEGLASWANVADVQARLLDS